MYLQVQFLFERQVPTVLVPAAALATRRGRAPAGRPGRSGTACHYRTVQLGRDFGSETEVLAGIDAGETVVVNPGDDLPKGRWWNRSPPQSVTEREVADCRKRDQSGKRSTAVYRRSSSPERRSHVQLRSP